jgi:2-keto-4-pentenoate hydratase/2-oxohepta-3-ene-1,7-dioic acid hydratase in catechol pathway
MQCIRYAVDGPAKWGVRRGEEVVPLAGLRETFAVEKLAQPVFCRTIADAADAATEYALPIEDVRLLAPVPQPPKFICVGLNYHDHAEEQDEKIPSEPLLFGKAPTAVTNPNDPIVHPDDIEQVDYEVELGVVIGHGGKEIDAEEARDYIAGYTAINDISGRDAQFDDGQWLRGKSYDTFAPMGPTIVPDHAIDPNSLDVACRVNGETKQESNTEQFIFDVEELVEYISHAMTLQPGDIISTGTPGGVGIFREPPELLEPGDTVDVEIEGIGVLTNPVVSN